MIRPSENGEPHRFLLVLSLLPFLSTPVSAAQVITDLERSLLEGAQKARSACVRVDVMRSTAPGGEARGAAGSPPGAAGISVSGILLTPEGDVATVAEALVGAERVWVELWNQGGVERYKAEVVGFSPDSSVGVVHIRSDRAFRPLHLGDPSTLQPGALVMSLAYTSGLGPPPSFNVGVVSAMGRPFRMNTPGGAHRMVSFIQTSLPIHPGETGAPVLDRSGRLVGMLFSTFPSLPAEDRRREGASSPSPSQRWEPYTLVVPIQRVKREAEAMLAREKRAAVTMKGGAGKPWLGLQALEITDEGVRRALQLPVGGVLVSYVFAGDPAGRAGIRKNDLLKAWNRKPIRNLDHLEELLRACRVGEHVRLMVLRNGKEMEVEVEIGSF